jgi:hypothetical protein
MSDLDPEFRQARIVEIATGIIDLDKILYIARGRSASTSRVYMGEISFELDYAAGETLIAAWMRYHDGVAL